MLAGRAGWPGWAVRRLAAHEWEQLRRHDPDALAVLEALAAVVQDDRFGATSVEQLVVPLLHEEVGVRVKDTELKYVVL